TTRVTCPTARPISAWRSAVGRQHYRTHAPLPGWTARRDGAPAGPVERKRRSALLTRCGAGTAVPRPPALQLHLEREAEEGADQHDHREHADAAERGRYGQRADDVPGDEGLYSMSSV